MHNIVLSLWRKGYSTTLYKRIIFLIARHNVIKKDKINRYLDLGSSDFSFVDKIVSSLNPLRFFTSDINLPDRPLLKNHVACNFNEQFLPFKDNIFDVVTCSNVIEHLFDTDNFLQEVKRVLQVGGVFIIATNNISVWTNILSLIFGRQPNANQISDYGDFGRLLQKDVLLEKRAFTHRRIFSFIGLKRVLEFHGFKIISSRRCVFYPLSGILERIFEKVFKNYCAYIVFVVEK